MKKNKTYKISARELIARGFKSPDIFIQARSKADAIRKFNKTHKEYISPYCAAFVVGRVNNV